MTSDRMSFAVMVNMYGHPPETAFTPFVELAKLADELGFDAIYTIDHLFTPAERLNAFSNAVDPRRPYFLEAWTSLAALAMATKQVRLGPMVSPLNLRHPVWVAKMAATIDRISNGRLVLPVGTGWNKREYDAFGFHFEDEYKARLGRLLEGVEVINRLWTEDQPVTFEGEYYQLKEAWFWPKPVQKPRPPIWLGGNSKGIQRAVARLADGWTPSAPHYAGFGDGFYGTAWQNIEAMARAANRDPDQITRAAWVFTCVANDRATAVQAASMLRKRPDWSELTIEELEERGIVIVGTPEDCIRSIERYAEWGVRYLTLSFVPISDVKLTAEGMRLYHDRIFPYFQAGRATAGRIA